MRKQNQDWCNAHVVNGWWKWLPLFLPQFWLLLPATMQVMCPRTCFQTCGLWRTKDTHVIFPIIDNECWNVPDPMKETVQFSVSGCQDQDEASNVIWHVLCEPCAVPKLPEDLNINGPAAKPKMLIRFLCRQEDLNHRSMTQHSYSAEYYTNLNLNPNPTDTRLQYPSCKKTQELKRAALKY